GVREDHLRSLLKFGLISRPVEHDAERRIAFADLAVIRRLYKALQEGAPFKAVLRAMLASREGQLALDFRLESQPATVVSLQPALQNRTRATPLAYPGSTHRETDKLAEEYFLVASSLDDGSAANQPRAALGYRRALEVDPALVPALINLANIHYANDQLIEALALYDRAVRLDPEVFEGHFNLGNIYHDLGRYAEAEGCYRRALELNPGYPEAHLYMAVALEKAGKSEAARLHWKAYQSLAPDGEWVDLAREFSE
ncbi:MAG: tetratricopeptide repeat protein, partial [Vicinamibacterales bacterium]|nr:tetratricopeptide repeat protein [Vicinamibacterales bacterium]